MELHSLSLEGGCELPGSELGRAVTDMTVSGAGKEDPVSPESAVLKAVDQTELPGGNDAWQ